MDKERKYMGEIRKPPIGITPRWLLDEEREIEINQAIDRYNEVGCPIPIEWIKELKEIQERLKNFYNGYYHGIYYNGKLLK